MVIVPDTTSVRLGAVNRSVRSPIVPVMAKFVNVATPLAVVVAVGDPLSVPPPVAIAAVTTTPLRLTGFPETSCSWIAGCWVKATPLCALGEGCVVTASRVAAPAVMVIVPDTTSVRLGAVNRSVRSPIVPVMAKFVNVATPLAVVVAVGDPLSVPPPVAIAAVTTTPLRLTGFPETSCSWIAGCWVKATPLCALGEGWVVTASRVAAPAVMVIVPDTTSVRLGAVNRSVRSPIVPVMAKFVNVATPLAVVVAVGDPLSVPPPVAIAAVTTTPLRLTGFPETSCSWIAGCWVNGTPLCALGEGWVVTASRVAAPAVMSMTVEVAEVRLGALKLNVRGPIVPVMAKFVNVATPLAVVVAVGDPLSVPPPVAQPRRIPRGVLHLDRRWLSEGDPALGTRRGLRRHG